jgi:hypothetical protein
MLIKTENFVRKLNSKLYQYTFNKNRPLDLKGSFKITNYISDIDYTAYVYFNERFIDILIKKLRNLKDFKFIYLNAGTDKRFILPWKIYPEWGCNFDFKKTMIWFSKFRKDKLVPKNILKSMSNILGKKRLKLGDLIDIQEILNPYKTIKWSLDDIVKRKKIVGNHMYNLLDELKTEDGPVLNSLYIDNKDVVSVDLGLVDRKYKQPRWTGMYKYYTQNWYKILKSYKFFIKPDYKNEYFKKLKNMEYINALLAQTNLVSDLYKYNNTGVSISIRNNIANDLITRLKKCNIETPELLNNDNLNNDNLNNDNLNNDNLNNDNLYTISEILTKKLNSMSKPYVDYFLDRLVNNGKIKTMQNLRLLKVTKFPIKSDVLISRRSQGIECPFLLSKFEEKIGYISDRILIKVEVLIKCLHKIEHKYNISYVDIFKKILDKAPVFRLFLQHDKKHILVRGVFKQDDHMLLNTYGVRTDGYYTLNSKYLKLLQAYLIT